jgi:transcriptional regulator with GAF, ATPase, and Fis domain
MKILFFDEQKHVDKTSKNMDYQQAIAVPEWIRLERVVVAGSVKVAIQQLQRHDDIGLILASENSNLQLLSQSLKQATIECPVYPLKPYYDAFVEEGLIGKPASSDVWLGLENMVGNRVAHMEPKQSRKRTNNVNLGRSLADVERELILETLVSCGGNRTNAADILGISVRTLRNKLVQYGESGRTNTLDSNKLQIGEIKSQRLYS